MCLGARRGAVSGEDEEEGESEQLLLAQPLAVHLGGQQGAHQGVARSLPALGYQLGEQLAERLDYFARAVITAVRERVATSPASDDAIASSAPTASHSR